MSRHSAKGTAWDAQRKRVLDRDGWVCQYCHCDLVAGDKTHPQGATVDHVEAVVLDPERVYSDSELVAACRRCNGRKQDQVIVRTTWENPRWFG
jgi:5-methylcytosine-specific restriction endonuclease McrA